MELGALSEALESLTADLGRARAEYLAGHAETLRLAAAYGAHGGLMRGELLGPLRQAAGGEPQARVLLNALVRAQIEGGRAPITDKIAYVLGKEVIRSLEDKWYFLDSRRRIGEETVRKQRKLIDQSRRRVLARLEPDFQEAETRAHTLMVDRGFTDYTGMCAELSGVDMKALLGDAEGVLEDTGPRYRVLLAEHLRAAGVHPDDARYHDLIYLFAGRYGPAKGLPDPMAAAAATCAGLGLDLEGRAGLKADLEAREGKRPGVHWVAERVPEAVHLIAAPEPIWITLPEALAAAGVAVGLASTPADLPIHRRALPDVGLVAAWGAVFASLAGNPAWLAVHAPQVDAEPQGRLFAFWWLQHLRWLAGSARFSRFLHGPGELADKADPFEHYMHEAVGARVERDNYLRLTGWFMDAALAFRGQCFGAQLLSVLEERHGDGWFAKPEAGAFLAECWANGWDGLESVAAACDIGEPGDVWPLLERLEGVLGAFTDED